MKARLDNLDAQLTKTLAPLYWVSGDEPFQLDQACQKIRAAAQHQGYSERQVHHVERGFSWEQLHQAADSLSLFAEKKLIELRIPSAKPGKEGSKVLQEYVARLPEDTILLIVTGKLEAATTRTKWFKAVEQAGLLIQVWPLDSGRLPQWLSQQLSSRGMNAEPGALQLLADRVEGNLLAADQEIEKLRLLYGPVSITTEQVQAAVADSARYDIFGLVDEALRGQSERISRMLFGLRSEGAEPVLVLWALTREIRGLALMSRSQQQGEPVDRVMASHYVWEKRKPLVRKALQRMKAVEFERLVKECHRIDKLIKGYGAGRVWDELLELALGIAGHAAVCQANEW